MNKVLFAIICIFTFSKSYSQTQTTLQTTQEEYTYVTKGYIDVLQRAVDVKRGYSVNFLTQSDETTLKGVNYKIDLKGLYVEGTQNIKAIIVVLYINSSTIKVICVPLPGSDRDIWQQYVNDIYSLGCDERYFVLKDVSQLASAAVSKKPGN